MNSQLETAPAAGPNYKWWVVFMLWFICFFNYADRQAISAIMPKLHEEFGFDKKTQGLIFSAFMWIYAAGAPFAGYVADRLRRKELILGGCLFWSFVTMLTGWCAKAWQFITVRALEGVGETFYFPASMSLVSDYHSSRTRSRAMSFHQSSVYIGTIAGSWFAALIAEKYGWRWGFYLFGFCGMVLAAMLYTFLREPIRGASEDTAASVNEGKAMSASETLGRIFRTPSAILLLLGFMGANCVAGVSLAWTPTFLVEKFHFTLRAAGLNGSVYIQIASALSVPLGGLLADRLARRWVGGRMAVQVGGLICGAAFVVMIGMTATESTLLIAMSFFGFFKGLYDANIFASMYDVVPPQARASAAGIMNSLGWSAGALGTYLFGLLAKSGGYGSEVDNMSHSIALGGLIYVISASLIFIAAVFFAKRDAARARLVQA